MFSPLISAKVRSTARRSAPWKSRLIGCPLNRRVPSAGVVGGCAGADGGCTAAGAVCS
jgi:hypothetical protein